VFRPERSNRLAFLKPHQAARLAVARNIEKLAGRPAEFECRASPGIQEPASVADGLPPFRIRNPHRLLDLQPRPNIEIRFRHAAHCHAFALLKRNVIGFGHRFLLEQRDNPGFVLLESGEYRR
jgi:hypothetical protein